MGNFKYLMGHFNHAMFVVLAEVPRYTLTQTLAQAPRWSLHPQLQMGSWSGLPPLSLRHESLSSGMLMKQVPLKGVLSQHSRGVGHTMVMREA